MNRFYINLAHRTDRRAHIENCKMASLPIIQSDIEGRVVNYKFRT